MRMDTIGQILTYSNIAAKRNVMVLESCKGLLLAAIVERMSGYGKIVNFSPNGSHISTRFLNIFLIFFKISQLIFIL
jgi:tRNA (adenine-N(1)-)-methyltransferase non-catalytic subunit